MHRNFHNIVVFIFLILAKSSGFGGQNCCSSIKSILDRERCSQRKKFVDVVRVLVYFKLAFKQFLKHSRTNFYNHGGCI